MKIAEATKFAELTIFAESPVQDKVKKALELAREIFAEAEERNSPFLYLTAEKWTKRWLPSRKFHLMRMPLNAAALPCQPKGENLVLKKIHAREEKPIVVDYNKNQVGSAMHGFIPPVVVIDGKHRFKAATMRGESYIMAWVGEMALDEIRASKKMCACGCGGIGACKVASVKAVGSGGGGPAPERTTPASGASLVAEFSNKGKKIKQMMVKGKKVSAGGPGSGRRPGSGKHYFDGPPGGKAKPGNKAYLDGPKSFGENDNYETDLDYRKVNNIKYEQERSARNRG